MLSDISAQPMRSQAAAAVPMGSRGRARSLRAGRAGPSAAAESWLLLLPLYSPGCSGRGGSPALNAQLGRLPSSWASAAHAPVAARLMPRGAGRAGWPAAAGS